MWAEEFIGVPQRPPPEWRRFLLALGLWLALITLNANYRLVLRLLERLRRLKCRLLGQPEDPVDFYELERRRPPPEDAANIYLVNDNMAISIRKSPSHRLLELGGGDRPLVHPECQGGRDVNLDVRMCKTPDGRQSVDIVAPLEEPLPLGSGEFDGVVSQYCLEHIGWRKAQDVVNEMARVLKPGGYVTLVLPNTEAQMRHLLDTQDWDDGGSLLMGGQDYGENTHKLFVNPALIARWLGAAGFGELRILPHGALATDMIVQATKVGPPSPNGSTHTVSHAPPPEPAPGPATPTPPATQDTRSAPQPAPAPTPALPPPETLFDRRYFNGGHPTWGGIRPFYIDRPQNELIFRQVAARRPESVLELGCGRGYVLKRLQDAGIRAFGIDVSKHAHMTRVCENIRQEDLTAGMWTVPDNVPGDTPCYDLCFSHGFLEHVPEDKIPALAAEMKRTCRRGLHGVTTPDKDDGGDKTRVTVRTPEWWRDRLPPGHEVFPRDTLEGGNFPEEVLKGDGVIKANIGCCYTMFHHGWRNCDVLDMAPYAVQNGYHFDRFDARQGLPWKTGEVGCLFLCHMLEHLSYPDGLSLLRECRRVTARDGAIRILVPDAQLLNHLYAVGEAPDPPRLRVTSLSDFDEINEGCAVAQTPAMKLYALLHEAHSSMYDVETLCKALDAAGWDPLPSRFRHSAAGARGQQIVKETYDHHYELSLIVEGTPRLG